MGLERYEVRRFDPDRDMDGAYRSFAEGFHNILWPIIDFADRGLVEDIIITVYRMGVATFVAVEDGEARGILAGGLPFEASWFARDTRLALAFVYRAFSRRHQARPFARACLRRVLLGYLPFLWRHPMAPSTETMMLTSQKDYRGGIGRAMMDVWVEESRARGYRRTTVCTDTALSWDFYERYGFERVREFPLTAYHYSLPADDVTGFIYSLDI